MIVPNGSRALSCRRAGAIARALWLNAFVWLGLTAVARRSGAQQVTIDTTPQRVIPGTAHDGAVLFGRVAEATRLANGIVVVGDGSNGTLKFIDPRNRVIRTAGRQGQGPGEFSILQWVRQCAPDSLFAYDMMRRGLSVFSSGGVFVRQFQVPAMPSCSRGGTFAILDTRAEGEPPEGARTWRARVPLILVDRTGAAPRELGVAPAYESAMTGQSWFPRAAGANASIAVGRRGVALCPSESGDVTIYELSRSRRSIRLDLARRAPTRRHLERSADWHVSFGPAGALRDTIRARMLRVPPPEQLPPCTKLLMDPDDNLWVVVSVPGDGVTRLRIFGQGDHVVGDVVLPEEMDVLEVGADYVLMSGENDDGAPWVRVYRVRRTAPR